MIDLHSHTNESDGTLAPAELIEEARRRGLHVLGITDHDTFHGYDRAVPHAREIGLDLVCGIELSTKLRDQSVHLLGYFLEDDAPAEFRTCVLGLQASRRDRNVRLGARLCISDFHGTVKPDVELGTGRDGNLKVPDDMM